MQRVDSLEKTLMLGKIEGRRRMGQQRMKRLDGIICSMDTSLSKRWQMVKDRGAWHASVCEVGKSDTIEQLNNNNKAFDCMYHNKLWKILKEIRIPDHLTCLLRNLYASQEATVRTGHGTTDWFQIGKRVCQGCILSTCLFNLYGEYIRVFQVVICIMYLLDLY